MSDTVNKIVINMADFEITPEMMDNARDVIIEALTASNKRHMEMALTLLPYAKEYMDEYAVDCPHYDEMCNYQKEFGGN